MTVGELKKLLDDHPEHWRVLVRHPGGDASDLSKNGCGPVHAILNRFTCSFRGTHAIRKNGEAHPGDESFKRQTVLLLDPIP